MARQLADLLGIEPTASAFGRLGPEELRTAQDALALALMTDPDPDRWGASIVADGLGIMSFFPMVDGDVIPDRPADILAAQPDRTVPTAAAGRRGASRLGALRHPRRPGLVPLRHHHPHRSRLRRTGIP